MAEKTVSKAEIQEKSSIYERIDLGDVTPHNINLLKKVNHVVFPIVYHDKFYKDVLEAGELAKLAYYNDVVVGAVCCRIGKNHHSVSKVHFFVQKLQILQKLENGQFLFLCQNWPFFHTVQKLHFWSKNSTLISR